MTAFAQSLQASIALTKLPPKQEGKCGKRHSFSHREREEIIYLVILVRGLRHPRMTWPEVSRYVSKKYRRELSRYQLEGMFGGWIRRGRDD